jgi:PASTA domain/Divergent InlB B-repeat domain/WD40-like Beta Propeller Repeat
MTLVGLVAAFVVAVSQGATGAESTYRLAVLYRSACPGFAIENVSAVISACVEIPPDLWPSEGEYSAAANGTIVFFAPPSGTGGGTCGPCGIWVVTPNGSLTMIDSSRWDRNPSISYDGSKVVFSRFDPATNSSDIYSANSDGSDLHEVVSGGGVKLLRDAVISPDGSSIAYWCGTSGYDLTITGCGPLTDGSYRYDGVMRVNIDGSDRRMIVIGPGDNAEPVGPDGFSWSPNGRWIAMDGIRPVGTGPYGPWRYLFKYHTDGSDLFNNLDPTRQITASNSAAYSPAEPQFSPDGSQLLYMDWVNTKGQKWGAFSYLIGADGSNPHEIFLEGPEMTCSNGSCDAPSYGAFIPTATPVAPPPLVDMTHITVPSVRALSLSGARRRLTSVNLTVGTVSKTYSGTVAKGAVVAQHPTAGTVAHRTQKTGPQVNLQVSRGAPPPGTRLLTVVNAGTGSGKVTSKPVGISCGLNCKHAFRVNTVVTLTASAKAGSTFTGWSGACTGSRTCIVTLSAAKHVKATFTRAA